MIIAMAKLRILGPRERLEEVLRVLQDLSLIHLSSPEAAPLARVQLTTAQERERRHLASALDDVERALSALSVSEGSASALTSVTRADLAKWVWLASRLRRETERLAARTTALEEERALIMKYQQFFSAFRALLESETLWPNATAYHVLLRGGDTATIPQLRATLSTAIGEEFQLFSQPLPSGETAVLIVVSAQAAGRVERLLAEARVQEIPVPEAYGGKSLTAAIPRMLERLGEIPREREQIRARLRAQGREHGATLRTARAALNDRLRALDALPLTGVTTRAFVLEGWVPTSSRHRLDSGLGAVFGDDVVVSEVSREEWESEQAPVVLSNPRLLRPFETLVGLMPLPRYGSIDPTPFVAVFFPAFFGLMVGDVGYGVVLAALGLLLHARSRSGTTLRNVSEIIGPCALFSIIAGILFGELFGDLGRRWFGMRPLLFDRADALLPFLLLAVAIGVVHVLLGLILGVVSARRHPRQAMGRGISAVMVVLVIVGLLAAVDVLPRAFFTPAVTALLVAFPVLIVLEGLVAPIELLATLGNILSYARIMALGVASVMMAVVANKMVGAMGSVVVGVVFALLFHLVNFAIVMFSPTIHALRLHYVEFFGKFFSPGGVRYQPFGHWTRVPDRSRPASRNSRQAA
ncbi:MAG TPA: V-type ATPase 116kDa subunit family protein [Gemmatimonadales bacterium]|nr:V-type ATPase 116kDa subunit family protein [Gemmatimonadales bacterium]